MIRAIIFTSKQDPQAEKVRDNVERWASELDCPVDVIDVPKYPTTAAAYKVKKPPAIVFIRADAVPVGTALTKAITKRTFTQRLASARKEYTHGSH